MPFVHKDVVRRLCKARDALRESGECPPAVPRIARAAGISTFHFIRLFRACFGETPHQVRLEARLERAKWLLLHTRRSVTDICLEAGFSSVGSFSYTFSRRVGVSPARYREKVRRLVRKQGETPPELIPGCFCLMARVK